MTKDSLSVQEVAALLDISKNTVYDLIKRNQLPSYRVGHKLRIDIEGIEDYKNKTRSVSPIKTTPVDSVDPQAMCPKYSSSYLANQSTTLQSQFALNKKELIICGQDNLLDILTRYLERPPYNIKTLRSYTGSYNGLVELYKGNVSIASAHLWSADTNSYNLPYIRYLLPGFSCMVVNLAYRMQGFYVSKGNPKNIQNWHDLTREDVVFLNRESGCGVRVLIDELLRINNIPKNSIRGYENVEFSHLAAASYVARGEADVSVGNEKTALLVENIDFVPIQIEQLDLVIPTEFLPASYVNSLLEILNSANFRNEIRGLGGYDTTKTGQIIANL